MIRGGRSRAASAGKKKRPVFGGQDSDAAIKFDSRNPVTARKEEAAKKAAAKKAAQAKMGAAVAKRTATQKTERDAMMDKVRKDRPMPKRPSATSLANAADSKAKRPAKPQTPPTTAPRPPKARDPLRLSPSVKMVLDAEKPPRPLRGTVTGKDKTSGKLRRNVGEGRDKRANVTKEQLKSSGMTLRQYLNYVDKEGKRPPKKAMGGGMMKSKMKAKGMKAGGKMKSKGYSAGGKMKAKGMSAGGKMKAKGMAVGGPLKKAPEGNTGLKKLPKQVRNKMGFMAKGGMMKTKGYSKGGAAGGKKQKVRGAGIARRGVRPAKMR